MKKRPWDFPKEKIKCTKITNVESIGENQYAAKAIITKDGKTGVVDIMYEEIDDLVQVYVDFDSVEWTD